MSTGVRRWTGAAGAVVALVVLLAACNSEGEAGPTPSPSSTGSTPASPIGRTDASGERWSLVWISTGLKPTDYLCAWI